MAIAQIRPDWTIGTLNLTAGVVEFTTTGSVLETAAIQAGDTIMVKGFVLVIATITGQNAGTLMEVCPAGAAGIGQPLRIRFQPDGSRYNGATADLVQLLGSGNLYEFAGLVGEPDGVPVFTGSGTMEVQPKSSFATPDPNGNLAGFSALALSGYQILQTDATGSLKTVNLLPNKFIRTNTTSDVTQGDLSSFGAALLSLGGTDGNIPVMVGVGGVESRPIVGIASNGALMQYGSNSSGEFVRFANGLQICWRVRGNTSVTSTARTEGGFAFRWVTEEWGYPAQFAAVPFISASRAVLTTGSLTAVAAYSSYQGLTATTCSIRTVTPGTDAFGTLIAPTEVAIGRWF